MSNFDMQPLKSNRKKTYNNGVITTQKHISKLGYRGVDCVQW